jgi:hypothetical protein
VDISMSDQASHSHGRQLDRNPPRPPRSRQSMSMMDMATGNDGDTPGLDTSNPAVQVMKAMGDAKNSLLKLSSLLPTLAQGIQQIIAGLEQVVPQQVADIVSGNAPGSGGSGMGSPQASAAPTAPPVQSGMQ